MMDETPVTNATFERLAAQDGPENLYTDEQVEIIQLRMGEMEQRAKAMEKAISGWILKTVERETLDEVAAAYRAWESTYRADKGRVMDKFEKWWGLLSKVPYRGKEEIARLAFEAGREAGMREASEIANREEDQFINASELTDSMGDQRHYSACASGAGSVAVAILSAIGGDK